MSRNGSGTYSLPAGNPVVTGTTIASTWANNTLSDIASALTGSVASDGQTPMTGNLDLNSNKIVNVTDPTLAQDAATKNYSDTTFARKGANSDITSLTGLTTPLSQAQGGTGTTTGYYGFKNRIINGAMMIDQRGAGSVAALSGSAAYPVDRFVCYTTSGSGNTGIRSTTVPSGQGFVNSLLVTVGTGASPSAGSYNQIGQIIEGFNVADLGYGGSGAKTTTLSFWVRASITGTYCVAFLNSSSAGTRRSYVAEYSISSANTWEYKTVTITGDTTGTWNTDNTQGLQVYFDIGSGSNFQTTANTWSNGALWRTSNQTNLIATNGATFYITGVQLEVGSTATSFDYRPYGTELQLCQRYYEVINSDSNQQTFWADCNGGNGVCAVANLFYRATKRATPTVTQYGTYVLLNTNSPSLVAGNNQMTIFYQTSSASRCYWYPSLNAGVTINAEL